MRNKRISAKVFVPVSAASAKALYHALAGFTRLLTTAGQFPGIQL
jgi:hypothetical protein